MFIVNGRMLPQHWRVKQSVSETTKNIESRIHHWSSVETGKSQPWGPLNIDEFHTWTMDTVTKLPVYIYIFFSFFFLSSLFLSSHSNSLVGGQMYIIFTQENVNTEENVLFMSFRNGSEDAHSWRCPGRLSFTVVARTASPGWPISCSQGDGTCQQCCTAPLQVLSLP